MIERFLPREEFSSYEDFKANFRLTIPEEFNFAYDVVDVWAEKDFHKPALVWINDDFQERRRCFGAVDSQTADRNMDLLAGPAPHWRSCHTRDLPANGP